MPDRMISLALLTWALQVAPELETAQHQARITAEVLAVQRARPSVVSVRTTYYFWSERTVSNFGLVQPARPRKTITSGSGFVVDQSGFIVTNYHVVRDATRGADDARRFRRGQSPLPEPEVHVAFDGAIDDRDYLAQVVSWDEQEDLAVLKIDAPYSLPEADLGTSSDLMLAERVILIGNPYGARHSVTVGIVSGLNRRFHRGTADAPEGMIQTDAPVNPGCSGGPLLNIHGQVIGLTTATHAGAENMGYAIPIDRVLAALDEQLLAPSAARAWLGFELEEICLGPDEFELLVKHVTAGGPADRLGLEAGDRLLAINDERVETLDEYVLRQLPVRPGEDLTLAIRCAGEEQAIVLTGWTRDEGILYQRLGLTVTTIQSAQRLPYVRVDRVRPGSGAEALGIQVGDLIDAIAVGSEDEGSWRIPSAADLALFIERLEPGTELFLDVLRDDDGDRRLGPDEVYTGSLRLD